MLLYIIVFQIVSTCCCRNHSSHNRSVNWVRAQSTPRRLRIWIENLDLQDNPVRSSGVKVIITGEIFAAPTRVLSDRHQALRWFLWYWDVLRLKKRVEGLVPSLNFLLAQTLKRDSCVQQDRDRGWLRWLAWLGSDMGVSEGVHFELSDVPERSNFNQIEFWSGRQFRRAKKPREKSRN